MNCIYNKSCEFLDEVQEDSVALTVTSPPYWNAIDYNIHALGEDAWYRERKHVFNYVEYLEWLGLFFGYEVHRVTKPGGFCAVVVGTILLDGKMYPMPFDFTAQMCAGDWILHQDIVWHKCTAGVKRAGVFIQHPYPGYFYPNIMCEYILIFRKEGPKIYEKRTHQEKEADKSPIDSLFKMDIANNIWHIAPVPPKTIAHPCPFPEEIPHRLISLYSYKNDLILDPFVGSGQTTKVAKLLGRRFVGYDIVSEYVDLATKRLDEPSALRDKQLVVRFDKVSLV